MLIVCLLVLRLLFALFRIRCGIMIRSSWAASVDDRTPEERAGKIGKSRYDSIDLYISPREELIPEIYNDVPVAVDEEAYKRLIDAGMVP